MPKTTNAGNRARSKVIGITYMPDFRTENWGAELTLK